MFLIWKLVFQIFNQSSLLCGCFKYYFYFFYQISVLGTSDSYFNPIIMQVEYFLSLNSINYTSILNFEVIESPC